MKKSDIAMLILIASLSVMIAFFIADAIPFLKPDESGVKVPVTQKIESSVTSPDTRVFNGSAINPTVETVIGGAQSTQ